MFRFLSTDRRPLVSSPRSPRHSALGLAAAATLFALAADLPYADMQSLTFEARQKLTAVRPRTLAQASRVPGVSPNDLQNLVLEVERRRRAWGRREEGSATT